jgi:hypothetical protein
MRVRIPVVVVLKKLEAVLAKDDANRKAQKEWLKDHKEWERNVVADAEGGYLKATRNTIYQNRNGSGEIVVTFAIPADMKAPKGPDVLDFRERATIEESIKVLKLTTDETVSASVVKDVAKYL